MTSPVWRLSGAGPFFLALLFLAGYPVSLPASPGIPQSYSSTPAPAPSLPFDRFSDSFRENHGLEEGIHSRDAAFEQGYAVVRLGLFDVWYPRYAMREKRYVQALKTAAAAILNLQGNWMKWVAEKDVNKAAARDLAVMQKWVKSWNIGKLRAGKSREPGRPDLLFLLHAKKEVHAASGRLADLMIEARVLGQRLENKKALFLVLSPSREDFLELGSFLGSLNDTNRRILWRNGLAMWTSFVRNGIHVLAMQHPSTWPGRGDITRGIDMNAREKSGLQQHLVQHLAVYLLRHYYEDRLPADLVWGLAINMVIELYKENNVRAGGGSKGRKTAAYSKFVAGGNAGGGRLAARNADNHWRHSKGRDFFLTELRMAQKDGARAALKTFGKKRDKRIFFTLQSDDGVGEAHLVRAPFLEGPDFVPTLPENVRDEALEFLRAYRSGFANWLKTRAKERKGPAKSEDLLQRLLRASGAPPEGEDRAPLDKLLQEIYGISLTDKDNIAESLEGRFLDWLSRKR